MIVHFVDRVLQMLRKKDKSAVIVSYDDWKGAFGRQDPTIKINKIIKLGVKKVIDPKNYRLPQEQENESKN